MDVNALLNNIASHVADAGLKLIAALLIWLLGRRLITFAIGLMGSGMRRQSIDATIIRYAQNTVSVLLNIALVIALLGFFGVETTSFAAFIAGASVAIGAAWAGLLANFAAGVFLVILRPFKTRDMIATAGVTGEVEEIGLFVTTINTPDNVRTYVGNAKIFSENVQNFSANPHRRVDITAPIAHSADTAAAIEQLKARVARISNVLATPAPEVNILTFAAGGCVLAVRPYCHNDHYWQVYFDTTKTIRDTIGNGGFGEPEIGFQTQG